MGIFKGKNNTGQEGCPGCGRVGGKHSSTCRHRREASYERARGRDSANTRRQAEAYVNRRAGTYSNTYTPSPYPGVKMVEDRVKVRGQWEKVYRYELDESWLRQHGG